MIRFVMAWKNYSLDLIPQWCQMSLDVHFDNMGGCWGIYHGAVAKEGEEHCRFCGYHLANAGKSEDELVASMRAARPLAQSVRAADS